MRLPEGYKPASARADDTHAWMHAVMDDVFLAQRPGEPEVSAAPFSRQTRARCAAMPHRAPGRAALDSSAARPNHVGFGLRTAFLNAHPMCKVWEARPLTDVKDHNSHFFRFDKKSASFDGCVPRPRVPRAAALGLASAADECFRKTLFCFDWTPLIFCSGRPKLNNYRCWVRCYHRVR